jgi:hypothetical protein
MYLSPSNDIVPIPQFFLCPDWQQPNRSSEPETMAASTLLKGIAVLLVGLSK